MHHGYREYYETGKKSQQKNLSDIDLCKVALINKIENVIEIYKKNDLVNLRTINCS